MFNKFQKLFAILAVVGVFAFGVGCAEYDDDIANLQEQIDNLTGSTSADLSSTVERLNSLIEAEKAAREASLAELTTSVNSQVAAANDRITALQTMADATSKKAAELETKKADQSALTAAVADLKKEISDSLEALGLDAYKAEVDARLTALEDANADIYEILGVWYNETLPTLQNDIAMLQVRIAQLEEYQEGLEAFLSGFKFGGKETLMEKLQAMDAMDEYLMTLFVGINKDLNSLTNRVWDVEESWNSWRNFWYGEKGEPGYGYKLDETLKLLQNDKADKKDVEKALEDLNKDLTAAIEANDTAAKEREEALRTQFGNELEAMEKALKAYFGEDYTTEPEKSLADRFAEIEKVCQENYDKLNKDLENKYNELTEKDKALDQKIATAVAELEGKLTILETSLTEQLAEHKGRLDALDSAVEQLSTDLATTQSDLEELRGEYEQTVEDLNAEIEARKEAIKQLQDNITELEQKVATNTGDITQNKIDIATNKAAIAENKLAIEDLDKRVTANENAIKALNEDVIPGIKQDIATLETTLRGELKAAVETINTRIDGVQSQLTELSDKYQETKKDVEDLLTRMGKAEGSLKEHGEKLETLDKDLKDLKGDLDTKAKELAEEIADLRESAATKEALADLKKEVEELEKSAATKEELAALKKVVEDLEKSAATKEALDELEKDIKAKLEKAIKDAEDNLKAAKEETQKALDDAKKDRDELRQMIVFAEKEYKDLHNKLNNKIVTEIAKVTAMFAKYSTTEQMNEAIADMETKISGTIQAEVAAANAKFQEIDGKIAALESFQKQAEDKLKALVARIQSLVYVPTHNDLRIHFAGQHIAYDNAIVQLTESTATVTYRVTPASLAAELVAAYASKPELFSFYTHGVIRTRIEDVPETLKIESLKLGESTGMIDFVVTPDLSKIDNTQDLAVALHVENTTETSVANEYTSAYTTATVDDGENVLENFVLVANLGKDEAGKTIYVPYEDFTHAKTATQKDWNHVLRYNQDVKKVVTLFEEAEIVYKYGNDYLTLDEVIATLGWNQINSLTGAIEAVQGGETSTLVNGTYECKDFKFQLTAADEDNIGEDHTDTANAYVQVGNDKFYLSTVANNVQTANVYTDMVHVKKDERLIDIDWKLIWNYGIWNTPNGKGVYTLVGNALTDGLALTDHETGAFITDLTDAQLQEILDNWGKTDATKNLVYDLTAKKTEPRYAEFSDVEITLAAVPNDTTNGHVIPTLKNWAYVDGTVDGLFVATSTVEGDTMDTTVTLTVNVEAPDARNIDIETTIEGLKSLNVYYMAYTAYSGPDNATLTGYYPAGGFYSAAEIEKFFDNKTEDALRMARIPFPRGTTPAFLPFQLDAVEAEATATAWVDASSFFTNTPGLTWDYADTDAALFAEVTNQASTTFGVYFTEFDFNNLPEVTFATDATDNYALEVPNGPIYPINVALTVLNPVVKGEWVKGARLSDMNEGFQTLRRLETGAEWADFVSLLGKHVAADPQNGVEDHAYVFLGANMLEEVLNWTPLKDAQGNEYYVEFAADDTSADAPFIDEDGFVQWTNLSYTNRKQGYDDNGNFIGNEGLYNTAHFEAYVKSAVTPATNAVTYKRYYNEDAEHYGVTIFAETPFNYAEQVPGKEEYTADITDGVAIDLYPYLTMTNLVTKELANIPTEMINNNAGFVTDFIDDSCYKLELAWGEVTMTSTVGGYQAPAFKLDETKGVLNILPNPAGLQHDYNVSVPYTITGNFGFVQEGTIEFKLLR